MVGPKNNKNVTDQNAAITGHPSNNQVFTINSDGVMVAFHFYV